MKTKLSLVMLFASAVAGPMVLADGENYDGQTLTDADFSSQSLVDSSWVGTNLAGTNLSDAILTNADFTGATLTGTYFIFADLTNADFTNAVIHGTDDVAGARFDGNFTLMQLVSTASYKQENLSRARFISCDLSGGNFSGFKLTGASFHATDLTNADFTGTGLMSADFENATLSGTNFQNAVLCFANFTDATLSGANFRNANLEYADFTNAVIHGTEDLAGAVLSGSAEVWDQIVSTASYKQKNLSSVDLSQRKLRGRDFSGFNLTGAKFRSATLTNANFARATLTGTDFSSFDDFDSKKSADLTNADFTDAVIHGTADVAGASFKGNFTLAQLVSTASYEQKDLSRVRFRSCDLSGGNFSGFNLTGASFHVTDLMNANFTGATLTGTDFWLATLTDADFTRTTLTETNFESADLTRADFTGTMLSGTNFQSATLTDADFTRTTLTETNFESADLTRADFTGTMLSGTNFQFATLTDANFARATLIEMNFEYADLTNADFTDAVIHGTDDVAGARFDGSFTLAQLVSTASYEQKNLSHVEFKSCDLSGGNFSGFNLTGTDFWLATLTDADFTGATLAGTNFSSGGYAAVDLTNADFTDAVIHGTEDVAGASFDRNFTLAQLVSTASYEQKNLSRVEFGSCNLSGGNFSGFNLTGTNFEYARLTNADFTDAVIHGTADVAGASFKGNFTLAQLVSTASYEQKDLSRVRFRSCDLSGGNFSGFNLTGTNFEYARLTNADFSGATLTGATFASDGSVFTTIDLTNANFTGATLSGTIFQYATLTNADFRGSVEGNIPPGEDAILADGTIDWHVSVYGGFNSVYVRDTLYIREYVPNEVGGEIISAKVRGKHTLSGGGISLAANAVLEICSDSILRLDVDGLAVSIFADETGSGTLQIDAGAKLEFSENCVVSVLVESSESFFDEMCYPLITWENSSEIWEQEYLTRSFQVSLNGEVMDPLSWETEIVGNTLYLRGTRHTPTINARNWVGTLPGSDYVGVFDVGLTDFIGSVSGAGSVRSDGNLLFAGDMSGLTGTVQVSAGTLTLAEAAKVGSGAFVVSDAGTLRIEGKREFGNTLSGAGTVVAAGEVTLSSDTGTFTGTLIAESGELISARGTTLTITGALEVEDGAQLRLLCGSSLSTAITASGNGSIVFAEGAKLLIDLESGQENFFATVMSWAETASVVGLDDLVKGENFNFICNGVTLAPEEWGYTIGNGALSVYVICDSNGVISDSNQDVSTDGQECVFSPQLSEYVGVISGSGNVHSQSDLNFKGNASDFSGRMEIDAGTFTVAEEAQIGTGEFAVTIAGTLRLEGARNFGNELSGAGTLATSGEITLSGNASGFSGTTRVESGTLTLAESAILGSGDFEVAGTLKIEGNRIFSSETSGAGTVKVSSGTTTFGTSLGVKTLQVDADASAVFDGVSLSQSETVLNGTLNVADVSSIATTLSGAGTLNVSGDSAFSSDASAFSGTISVESGTLTLAQSAVLGVGNFEVAGTLKIEGDRVLSNETSGDGAVALSAGADVSFSKPLGVKRLNVEAGATLRGNVSMTRGSDAALVLAGTLALNADAGEKVSLGGGTVVLEKTAKLDLYGNGGGRDAETGVQAHAVSSPIDALENGSRVTIFENGTVDGESGDIVSFLQSDAELNELAQSVAVIYDAKDGLTVQALTDSSALADGVSTSGLSASFVAWALGESADALASLDVGFVDAASLGGLGGNDPLLNALLSGNAGAARGILDRLSPKSYAAMIAMPVETFHDDAKNVSARLEQRRFDKFSETRRWEFFAQAQMISADNDDARDAPTFDFDRYGVFAGADCRLDESSVIGIALGAGTGEAKIHDGGGKIESDDYRLTVFGGKTFAERVYVNAGAQLGFASYEVKRRTDYGNADADTDGWNAGVFAEAGIRLALSEAHGVFATPYIGAGYTHAEADSFSESGSEKAAFSADSLSGDSLRARIGCGFSWSFEVAGTAARLGLDVAYSRELLDDEIDVDVRAKNGAKISEKAAALSEDVFSIGPTLDVSLTDRASVYAGYAFSAGTDSSTRHSANAGFRLRF